MSWHYLQGQEAASWEGSSLDGAPSALLKLIPTHERSCSQDKLTDASNRSPFGMTLRRSTATKKETSRRVKLLYRRFLEGKRTSEHCRDAFAMAHHWIAQKQLRGAIRCPRKE